MFEKILVAVDLELEPARQVLRRARELNQESGEVWVIHAVEPQYVQYSIDPTFSGKLTRAMELDALNAASGRVAQICSTFGIAEDHQLVMLGRPADQIHKQATEKAVDTIVIGSHARRGLQRLLGSTANSVLHDAPVNVMTIRLQEEDQ